MSMRAYGRHRGVALSAVQKAIKSGRISLINKKIDPVVADIQWAQNTNATQQERGSLKDFEKTQAQIAAGTAMFEGADNLPGTSAAQSGLSKEKTETEAVRRQLMELTLAKQRGELVNVNDVKRAWGAKLIDAKTALANIANELAPRLAAETDVLKIKMLLQERINAAMQSASQEAPVTTQ